MSCFNKRICLISMCLFLCVHGAGADDKLPPEAVDYDPSGQIRFSTPAEADGRREKLIKWIWSEGLPVKALPAVTSNIDLSVFNNDLGTLDGSPAASVDRLDANIAPYDFHLTMYLIHPKTKSVHNNRLVVISSGHRGDKPIKNGVNDAANVLLKSGFTVLMADMPFNGFNTDKTIELPNRGGKVTISRRGSGGHRELFSKLITEKKHVHEGQVYRFFLEHYVQGINHFIHTNPDAIDVSFVGLSGGGWAGHMIAAVDTRIRHSFPVAGAYPLYCRKSPFPKFSHDIEQYYQQLYREIDTNHDGIGDTAAGVASWLEIFALGGYGPGRRQVQILNLYDTCCFFGVAFKTYDKFLSQTVDRLGQGKWKFHSDTTHKSHVISPDVLKKVIMPVLIPTEITPLKAAEKSSFKNPVEKSSTKEMIWLFDTKYRIYKRERMTC